MVDFTIRYQSGVFNVTYLNKTQRNTANVNSQVMDSIIAKWANTQDIGEFQRAFCQKPFPCCDMGYVASFEAQDVPPQADLVISKIRAAVYERLHGNQ